MSEIKQLEERIKSSMDNGVLTAHIRDDYEPVGDMMINNLVSSGEYITRKITTGFASSEWRIYKSGYEPY